MRHLQSRGIAAITMLVALGRCRCIRARVAVDGRPFRGGSRRSDAAGTVCLQPIRSNLPTYSRDGRFNREAGATAYSVLKAFTYTNRLVEKAKR